MESFISRNRVEELNIVVDIFVLLLNSPTRKIIVKSFAVTMYKFAHG